MAREPLTVIEWDIDQCTLNYGSGACTAVLGATGDYKCFKTRATCQDLENYSAGTLTLKFVHGTVNTPKDDLYFPCVESYTSYSTSVNLAGSNPKLGNLGKRGEFSFTLNDFTYHDRGIDPYASERVTGVAQSSGVGYLPEERGTFLRRLKARFPNYANSKIRKVFGYVEDGVFTPVQTLHFILEGFDGPKNGKTYEFTAKDILKLTEEDEALVPKAATGYLASDINESSTTVDLVPTGVGDSDYPTSGQAILGDEILEFTRSGDTITFVTRGLDGTDVSSHETNDPFQVIFVVEDESPDETLVRLLETTEVPAEAIKTVKWRRERKRWCPTLKFNTKITEPTGVSDLIAEWAILGISVWWDAINYEVGFNVNSPVDVNEEITDISDNDIISLDIVDNDEDRLTNLLIYFDQKDYTGSLESASNYNQVMVIPSDQGAIYDDTNNRIEYCRWLKDNGTTNLRIAGVRLLQRFDTAPVTYTMTVDEDYNELDLISVLRLETDISTDPTGLSEPVLIQVKEREDIEGGSQLTFVAQRFYYEGNYGFVMENTANQYDSATDQEKEDGAYLIAEGNDTFDDGYPAYIVI